VVLLSHVTGETRAPARPGRSVRARDVGPERLTRRAWQHWLPRTGPDRVWCAGASVICGSAARRVTPQFDPEGRYGWVSLVQRDDRRARCEWRLFLWPSPSSAGSGRDRELIALKGRLTTGGTTGRPAACRINHHISAQFGSARGTDVILPPQPRVPSRIRLGIPIDRSRAGGPPTAGPRGLAAMWGPSVIAGWGWSESVSQMPWRVQTFWLAGSRTGKRLLAISAVSGSRARCRHQGPAVDECRHVAPSPGQLPVPGIADLASLAMRRLWERLEAGEAAGRPASAPAGHTPIRSASASRPSPSCSAGLTAAGPRAPAGTRVASSTKAAGVLPQA
jgi:hypothetical protein